MTLRFVYTRPDGGVSIVNAAPKEQLERVLGPLTDGQYLMHVQARSIPPGSTNAEILPDDWTLPDDRTFRNAWRKTGVTIAVDMPLARDIWRDRMRLARKSLLAALDVEMSRAYKDLVKQDEIEAKRQALRDVTANPAIEAAKTPDELKVVWPAALASR